MDHPLLVRVLHRLADLREQFQTFRHLQVVQVAVIGDRDPLHTLHHEVRTSVGGCAGIQHPGDVRVIHHRQRLTLRFEAGHDLLGVHPQLDDLERDAAAHRLGLLRQVDDPHATLADPLEDPVGTDLGRVGVKAGGGRPSRPAGRRRIALVSQDRLDLTAEIGIVLAGFIEKYRALGFAQGGDCLQDLLQAGGSAGVHEVLPSITDQWR